MANGRLVYDFLFTRGRLHRYGPHPSQCAELHLPSGAGPHPVVVLVHGGSWRDRYSKRVMRSLAADLARRGIAAAWNIEYRRLRAGGGWPETFADVAAAIDFLAELDAPLDLERIDIVGHSAGGHLALWAAGRERLPPGAPGAYAEHGQRVRIGRVVSMAGVCDLAGAFRDWNGGVVLELMGASPEQEPSRYAAADPIQLVPLAVPVLLVHGIGDQTVSIRLSRDYAKAARGAGGDVTLVELEGHEGRHRAYVYSSSEGWRLAVGWLTGGRGEQAQIAAAAAD